MKKFRNDQFRAIGLMSKENFLASNILQNTLRWHLLPIQWYQKEMVWEGRLRSEVETKLIFLM